MVLTGGSMSKRVLIINGHPDPRPDRFVHALADAYQRGALAIGHEVRRIDVGAIDFPLLRSAEEFASGTVPGAIQDCQDSFVWAEHVALFFPLWLGSMPAKLKALLEQVLRPGVAFAAGSGLSHSAKLLSGKSARIVVTMGMPALVYRWYFRAHSLRSLERNVLAYCGFAPVRASVVGSIEAIGPAARQRWLARMKALGVRAR